MKTSEHPKIRLKRMLVHKIAVMRDENKRLDQAERNIKLLAKKLGITLQ